MDKRRSILARFKGDINVDFFGCVRVACHLYETLRERQSGSVGKARWRSLPEVIHLGLIRWRSLRFAESICFDSIAIGTLQRTGVGGIDRAT